MMMTTTVMVIESCLLSSASLVYFSLLSFHPLSKSGQNKWHVVGRMASSSTMKAKRKILQFFPAPWFEMSQDIFSLSIFTLFPCKFLLLCNLKLGFCVHLLIKYLYLFLVDVVIERKDPSCKTTKKPFRADNLSSISFFESSLTLTHIPSLFVPRIPLGDSFARNLVGKVAFHSYISTDKLFI
jgi:hypothetical protein